MPSVSRSCLRKSRRRAKALCQAFARDGQGREDANRLVAGVVNLDQVHGPIAPYLGQAGADKLHHRLVHRLPLPRRKPQHLEHHLVQPLIL